MKETLQGRRFGFAPRPHLGHVALGLAIGVTLADLMAWFQWGARETNGFAVVALWLAGATAVVSAAAAITAVAEWRDAAASDAGVARLDLLAAVVAVLLYIASAALRAAEPGAAAASPAPFLLAIGGLILLVFVGVISAALYAGREWEVPEEDELAPERQRRRRAAVR